jgi:glutaredoxin
MPAPDPQRRVCAALGDWGRRIPGGAGISFDADGQVHFGDRPPTDAASDIVNVRPNVYDAPSIEALPEPLASTPERVLLYSTRWCGFCTKARPYFQANGISFEEYDVETSAKGKRDYARLGAGGVPVILAAASV